jgi:hypothetical protein
MALGSTQPLTEMSTRNISWGQRRPVRRADNLTNFMCRLSWNLGASTSWNPQGLSRPVMGLLYLYFYPYTFKQANPYSVGAAQIHWKRVYCYDSFSHAECEFWLCHGYDRAWFVGDVIARFSVSFGLFRWLPQHLVGESLMKDLVDWRVLLCSSRYNLLLATGIRHIILAPTVLGCLWSRWIQDYGLVGHDAV